MASVTASDFKNAMHLGDTISDTNIEYMFDWAIDTLNLYGAEAIDNMTGDAGSKTVTLTSRQRGGVFHVLRIIYEECYKGRDAVAIGGLSVTAVELLANPTVMAAVEKIAKKLSTVDFLVGDDTSGM